MRYGNTVYHPYQTLSQKSPPFFSFFLLCKKSSQKAPRIQLSRKTNKRTSVISISRLSGPSSSHSRTPPGSTPSLVPSSEDYANVNTAPSDGTREFEDSESMQSKQTREDEEPVNYCKLPFLAANNN